MFPVKETLNTFPAVNIFYLLCSEEKLAVESTESDTSGSVNYLFFTVLMMHAVVPPADPYTNTGHSSKVEVGGKKHCMQKGTRHRTLSEMLAESFDYYRDCQCRQ